MTWEEALAALGHTEDWVPPQDLGPLPESLVPRAREILTRLGAEIAALEERQAEVGRELAGTGSSPPQFIDTRA